MREEYHNYIEEDQRKAEFDYIRYLNMRAQKRLSSIKYGIMFLLMGLCSVLIYNYNFFGKQYSFLSILIGVTSFAFGLGFILFRYLQNGSFSKFGSDNISSQRIRAELQDLRFEILRLRKKNGESTDYEKISNTINNAINSTITEEFIKAKIDSFYSDKAISELKRKDILEDFENLSYRINGELTRLRKSANLNLVIGTLTTICAIFALGYEVFNNELEFSNTTKVFSHYVPRLSLIVFVEIFAFFFLKLYKTILSDIKYFNNEKTNIDFKIISLKTALNVGDTKSIQSILEELIKTERNFKLAKNESTVELEKIKNDTANNQMVAQLFEKLNKK